MQGQLLLAAFASAALLACAASGGGGMDAEESPGVPAPSNALASDEGSAKSALVEGEARAAVLSEKEKAVNARPLKLPLAEPKIVVEKGARRLRLFDGAELLRVRPVALGFEPAGDKEREGDGRTPEGEFRVCMKNERSKFYFSLGLTYPNEEDAERGLRAGLITRAQYERILSAIKDDRCPPWDTPLGGEIFIHGGGAARDWTWGCVALENEAIKELFDAVPRGTLVVVRP